MPPTVAALKVASSGIPIPVETSLPVLGHLIITVYDMLNSFAKTSELHRVVQQKQESYTLNVGSPGGRIRIIHADDMGSPYFIIPEVEMARIPDNYLDCAVYLYPSEKAAREGERAGGSGFMFAIRSKRLDDLFFPYIVTNSHVIREGNSLTVRINNVNNGHVILQSEPHHWFHHPDGDDIAVMPVGLHPNIYKITWMVEGQLLTKEAIDRFNIGIGDDVVMVGRFINHEGRERNLPALRFGNVSMMPLEPIKHPTRGINQECFLVEMRSIGGYSGSPCIIVYDSSMPRPGILTNPLQRQLNFWLLGINCGHIQDYYKVIEETGEEHPEKLRVKMNTNMSIVIPAWKIGELLNEDELVKLRRREENKLLQLREHRESDVSLDIATEEEQGEVFTREDFMDALKRATRPLENQPPDQPGQEKKGT